MLLVLLLASMEVNNTKRNRVKTTDSAFNIIETLHKMNGARVTELANELDMAKSTIHRHLSTLHQLEYLVKEGDEYHVGLRFLTLGEYARNRKKAYRMIQPKVEALAKETEERAQFIVEEHGKAVYVQRETGSNAVHTPNSGVGKRIQLHATSAGKAILAELPKSVVRDIMHRQGMPMLTDNTITDEEELFEELDKSRERGYSVNLEENIKGIRAVGVAITPGEGHPIGALSISGPSHRMKGEWFNEEIPDLLLGTTNELELNIAYS
jgi:DNA-binding IclR family transcriptional regulator